MTKHVVVVGFLALASAILGAQAKPSAPEPIFGTWKVNPEKSKYSPGPGPKSQTLTYERTTTGFRFTVDTVNAQGQTTHLEVVGAFDGKPYPVQGQVPNLLKTSRRIDDRTYEDVDTLDGKTRTMRRTVISADGKTLTLTAKGINAQGVPTHNVPVFEKQ